MRTDGRDSVEAHRRAMATMIRVLCALRREAARLGFGSCCGWVTHDTASLAVEVGGAMVRVTVRGYWESISAACGDALAVRGRKPGFPRARGRDGARVALLAAMDAAAVARRN